MVTIVTPPLPYTEPLVVAPAGVSGPAAPARRKLPAYGKQLLDARRAGKHPQSVTLVYGDKWWEVSTRKICVKPSDYVPGAMDWRIVAGLQVVVIDQEMGIADFDLSVNPPRFGKFYALLGELAAMDAFVVVRYSDGDAWVERHADELAHAGRYVAGGRFRWPQWWSDDHQRRFMAAADGWTADMGRVIRLDRERGRAQ